MNVQQLIETIELHFDCSVGPPRAYFEVPTADDDPEPAVARVPEGRYVYSVLRRQVFTSDTAEARLCKYLSETLATLLVPGTKHRLIWRYPEKVRIASERPHTKVTELRTRICIPGVNLYPFEVREGLETPFLDGIH